MVDDGAAHAGVAQSTKCTSDEGPTERQLRHLLLAQPRIQLREFEEDREARAEPRRQRVAACPFEAPHVMLARSILYRSLLFFW